MRQPDCAENRVEKLKIETEDQNEFNLESNLKWNQDPFTSCGAVKPGRQN